MTQIASANKHTLDALSEVNILWLQQKDIDLKQLGSPAATQHREWIKVHLNLVEQQLRIRSVAHLSPKQTANRLLALDHLNAYWKGGNFPVNDRLNYATPIFIDQYDNFCAVGYLVKATGLESVSRTIAASTNLAYVKEMNYPELHQWAQDFGFSVDELAWIQPSYYPEPPQPPTLYPLGNGVNGSVDAMCADESKGRVYFGGHFQLLENGAVANNVGYFKKTGNQSFDLQTLGAGLNGKVAALNLFDGRLIAAGQFSASDTTSLNNIAVWNDTLWQAMGCLNGAVSDLLVHDGMLFAAGHFSICDGDNTLYGFAKWDGVAWQTFQEVLGKVNKIITFDGNIVLGGNMFFENDNRKTLKWNATSGFSPFQNDVAQEVTAFGIDSNVLYLGMTAALSDIDTSLTFPTSETGLATISSGDSAWTNFVFTGHISLNSDVELPSIRAFIKEAQSGVVYVGGKFDIAVSNQHSIGDYNQNTFGIGGPYHISMHHFFSTNAAVHCFASLNGDYYMGGDFTADGYRGLGKMFPQMPTSISDKELLALAKIYPNPIVNGSVMVELEFVAAAYGIYDLNGKLLKQQRLNTNKAKLDLSRHAPGVYFLNLIDGRGNKAAQKIVIK